MWTVGGAMVYYQILETKAAVEGVLEAVETVINDSATAAHTATSVTELPEPWLTEGQWQIVAAVGAFVAFLMVF